MEIYREIIDVLTVAWPALLGLGVLAMGCIVVLGFCLQPGITRYQQAKVQVIINQHKGE